MVVTAEKRTINYAYIAPVSVAGATGAVQEYDQPGGDKNKLSL